METSYKEKYEQALAKAKEQYNYPCMRSCMGILEEIFPELAESEDEKMMKEIIELVMQPIWKTEKEFYRRNELCAWLKKQVEHANFLSKIQVGDKVTRNEAGVLVNLSQLNRVAKTEENKGNIGGISSNWSEEDEQHIDSLLKRLDALCRNKFERTRFAISEDREWLKSLRPQNRWKPSSEQIGLLQAIINEPKNAASESCQIVLREVLEQLKKLKGEV